MMKILKAIFISFLLYLLIIKVIDVTHAQSPNLLVDHPESVREGEKVHITGENLTDGITVTLSTDAKQTFVLDIELESDTSLYAQLPDDIRPGNYKLCVTNLCFSYEVLSSLNPQVVAIDPPIIYNTQEQQLTISAVDVFSSPLYLKLGNDKIHDLTFEFDDSENQELTTSTIVAIVPPNLPIGMNNIIMDLGNQLITSSQSIEIKGSINPKVESITPVQIWRFSEEITITIQGENLSNIKQANFGGHSFLSSDDNCIKESDCKLILSNTQNLQFRVNPSSSSFESSGFWPIALEFPDGTLLTEDDFTSINIIDRAFPWNNASRFYFFIAIISVMMLVLWTYNKMIGSQESKLLANQMAPSFADFFSFIITVLAVVMVCTIIIGPGVSNPISWTFLMTTAFIAINTSYPIALAHINGKFYEVVPEVTRYAIAGLALTLAWLMPYFFTNQYMPQWAILSEIIILLVTTGIGFLGLRYAHQKLEEQRNYVPDSELLVQVEQKLYRQGRIVAAKDFSDFAQDRVLTALDEYVAQYSKTQDLNYERSNGTLSFNRREAIYDVSSAFDQARKSIRPQRNVDHLVKQLHKHMALSSGKRYELSDFDPAFTFFSTQSSELESILPTPFPIIVYSSQNSITEPHISELKSILNKLDVKSRFALFIPLNEVKVTRERIDQEVKNRRAAGNENIVILGEQELLDIFASRKPQIREALMEAIQAQVDLIIFSPYRAQSVTPLDMFYGRKKELGTVLETIDEASVAILGTRRMGKTSLFQAIRRELEERGKLLFYLDLYAIDSYDYLCYEIGVKWKASGIDFSSYRQWKDFSKLVHDLQKLNPNHQIIFQMDEIDRLLDYDGQPERREKFFRMLRALSQEKRCQFIFSGERTILDQLANPESCFFNFAKPVKLELLDHKTTNDLVLTPMKLVGIKFQDEANILQLIYDQTAGHPNLIQSLCEECLDAISETKTRLLTIDIVKNQCNVGEYKEKYVNTFLSQANFIEKAIAIYICQHGKVNKTELIDGLEELRFDFLLEDIERGLRYLTLGHLLDETEDGHYIIKPLKFKEYYFRTPYKSRIRSLLRQQRQKLRARG